jgi:hypothetical protein
MLPGWWWASCWAMGRGRTAHQSLNSLQGPSENEDHVEQDTREHEGHVQLTLTDLEPRAKAVKWVQLRGASHGLPATRDDKAAS